MRMCDAGKHKLIIISSTTSLCGDKVVRWCDQCGAIVIDEDCDTRTRPGAFMSMRLPASAKPDARK